MRESKPIHPRLDRVGYSISEPSVACSEKWGKYAWKIGRDFGINTLSAIMRVFGERNLSTSLTGSSPFTVQAYMLNGPMGLFLDLGGNSYQVKMRREGECKQFVISSVGENRDSLTGVTRVKRNLLLSYSNHSYELDALGFDEEDSALQVIGNSRTASESKFERNVAIQLGPGGRVDGVFDKRKMTRSLGITGAIDTEIDMHMVVRHAGKSLASRQLRQLQEELTETEHERFEVAGVAYAQVSFEKPRITWVEHAEAVVVPDEKQEPKTEVVGALHKFGSPVLDETTYQNGIDIRGGHMVYPVNYLVANMPPDLSLFNPVAR